MKWPRFYWINVTQVPPITEGGYLNADYIKLLAIAETTTEYDFGPS